MTSVSGTVVTVPALARHESIAAFKREMIARSLADTRGNRTRAARALGLQRTYLLRLIRGLGVTARQPVPATGISG